VLIILIHTAVAIYYKSTDNDNKCGKLAKYLFSLFTFTIYVRMLVEAFMILFLGSMKEIYDFKLTSKDKVISFILSVLIIVFLVIVWMGTCFIAKK
jgi:hypothetical protein